MTHTHRKKHRERECERENNSHTITHRETESVTNRNETFARVLSVHACMHIGTKATAWEESDWHGGKTNRLKLLNSCESHSPFVCLSLIHSQLEQLHSWLWPFYPLSSPPSVRLLCLKLSHVQLWLCQLFIYLYHCCCRCVCTFDIFLIANIFGDTRFIRFAAMCIRYTPCLEPLNIGDSTECFSFNSCNSWKIRGIFISPFSLSFLLQLLFYLPALSITFSLTHLRTHIAFFSAYTICRFACVSECLPCEWVNWAIHQY